MQYEYVVKYMRENALLINADWHSLPTSMGGFSAFAVNAVKIP